MHKLLQLLRFFSVSFFFVIYGHASIVTPIPIDMNSTVDGALTSESETSPNSHNASEYYTFALTEEKNVIISLESTIYYKFYLLDGNGSVIKEVSKYDYTNNKIVMTLAQGNYKIDVTTVFNDEFGSFRVSLRENVIATYSIALETILDGEWKSSSGISLESSHYTNYYTFTLLESKDVLINLEYSGNTRLYLFDENQSIIATESGYQNTKIIKSLKAGTYTIDVTTEYKNVIGIYTLRLKENIISTTNIELDSIIDGDWNVNSGTSTHSGNYATYYTFTLQDSKDIVIDVESSGWSSVYLLDDNNTVIDTDSNYNHTKIVKTLDAGTYTMDISRYSGDTVGLFTLRFKENIISTSNIELNSIINGEWGLSSGVSPRNKKLTNYYAFTLNERKDIVIDLESNSGTTLYLLDEQNNTIEETSGSGYRNTRIVKTLEAGKYILDVTIGGSYEFGTFILNLKENIITNTNITLNSTTDGEWTTLSGISSRSKKYTEYYSFTLQESKNIVIDVESNEMLEIYLLDNYGNVIISQSGYQDRKIVITLDAGTYVLDVSTDYNDELGTFVLNLKENVITNTNIALNSITDGEWSTLSGVSPRSMRYSNYYTFTLSERKNIVIDLNSSNEEVIYVLDNNGYAIRYISSLGVTTLDAGTYILDVTTNYWRDEVGVYTLYLRENIISSANIVFNTPVVGEWTNLSGILNNRYMDYYTFSLSEETNVSITLDSAVSKRLYLGRGIDNSYFMWSDYSYETENSNITMKLGAGQYKIGVAVGSNDKLGTYTIQVNANVNIPNVVAQIDTTSILAYASTISWQVNIDNTIGYRIYLNNKLVADVGADINHYELGGLMPDTAYNYSIVAYNSAGESEAVRGTFQTKKDDYAWLVPVYHTILY